jgi:hypothetical protein
MSPHNVFETQIYPFIFIYKKSGIKKHVCLLGNFKFPSFFTDYWGHYATSRKVAGSSPDEVNFFQFA